MKQKLVVISDVHVHPWSAFSKGSGATNSRMRQTLSVLDDSLRHAEENDAIWICAGDIVHTQGLTKNTVLNMVTRVLECYPDVVKLIIWGNHDSRGKGQTEVTIMESAVYTLGAIPNLYILDASTYFHEPSGLTIYGEGAQPRKEHLTFNGDFGHDVYVGHFIVDGCSSPTGYVLDSNISLDEILKNPTLAIVGDVHKPQVEMVGKRALLIPGAPEHHNFGDGGDDRGYWEVTMELHKDRRFYPTELVLLESDSPKFITTGSLDEIEPGDGNFYRLTSPVPPGATVPDNVVIVTSAPTVVEQRDLLTGATTSQDVLQRYVQANPPDVDVSVLDAGKELIRGSEERQIKNVNVEQIYLKNFFSYETQRLDLDEGITLVTGESRDFQSNGAGKSTLFEALYWCLFGKTTKGVSAGDEIRRGEDECVVSVVMSAGDVPVKVERRRGRSISVEASIGGDPIVGGSATEVTDQLLDYLGVTEDIFRALAYYSQEDVLLFSRSTDGERKALLSDLCGLGMYERARGEAREMAKAAGERVERKEGEYERRKGELVRYEEELDEKVGLKKEWSVEYNKTVAQLRNNCDKCEQNIEIATNSLNARLDYIRDKADNLGDMWVQATENVWPERFAKKYEFQLQKLIEERKQYPQYDVTEDDETALQAEIASLKETRREFAGVRDHLELSIQSHSNNIARIEGRIEEYEEQIDNPACPTCGRKVEKEFFDELIAQEQKLLDELNVEYDEFNDEVSGIQKQIDGIDSELEELTTRAAKVGHQVYSNKRHAELQRKIEEHAEWVEEQVVQDVKDAIERHTKRQQRRVRRAETYVERCIEKLDAELTKLQSELKHQKDKVNPYDEVVLSLKKHVDRERSGLQMIVPEIEAAHNNKAVYEYWTDAFSKKGIQSLLLEDIASEFNKMRGAIFPLLTNGVIDVQFSTTAQTKKGELREKTDFLIMFNGDEVSYDSLSGGQRRRVDLGVMLTLAVANAKSRNINGILGMLIFDEVFDYLDADGAEGLHAALQEVQQIIPKIYVITQDSDMRALFDQTIDVVQDEDGVSWVA